MWAALSLQASVKAQEVGQAPPPPPAQSAPAQAGQPGAPSYEQGAPAPAAYGGQPPAAYGGQPPAAYGGQPPAAYGGQAAPQYPAQYAQPSQGYAQPGYPPPPRYGHPGPVPRVRRGMMITGISIFGGAYLLSATVAVASIDSRSCSDCDGAPFLFIPVIGPFMTMSYVEYDKGLFALLGMVQLVGAAVMTGGIIRFRNSKQAVERHGYYTLALPEGRSLSFDMSASPRRLGPELSLRF